MSTPRSNPSNTRSKNERLVIHLFDQIGLDPQETAYLLKKGLRSPSSIIQVFEKDRIWGLTSDSEFPEGSAALVERLAEYLIWYQETHSEFTALAENFTAQAFETFSPTKVIKEKTTMSISRDSPHQAPDGIKIRIADYPKYSGKSIDWPKFYEQFTAVAELQGIDDLLKESESHETRFTTDMEYQKRCNYLYSILKNCCATGMALPKINAFKSTKDGHSAWIRLSNHYYAKGNKQTFAHACLQKLIDLKLDSHTIGGPEQ